jgi:hypothetical protein
MKGLDRFPDKKQILDAYDKLKWFSTTVTASDLALFSQWARLEPTMAELVTEHLRDNWRSINPKELNRSLQSQPWPSTIPAMLEQITEMCSFTNEQCKDEFTSWATETSLGIQPARKELFFIGLWVPGGKTMRREHEENRANFKKWGYFCFGIFFNKQNPKTVA